MPLPLLLYIPAGYNVVIVESVGLGQSEVEIDNAVDMLIMIVPPGGGDGLQVWHSTKIYMCSSVIISILLFYLLFLSISRVNIFPLLPIKASKKGIMEAADMVVVNKADGEIEVFTFGLFVFIRLAIQWFIIFSCRFL